jgi:hypothetical protein
MGVKARTNRAECSLVPDELNAGATAPPAPPRAGADGDWAKSGDSPRPSREPHRRPPRRAMVAGALVVLAAVVVAVLLLSGGDDAATDGPLRLGESSSLGQSVHLGRPTAFGLPVVLNKSDQDVVLESVAPIDPLPGTRVIATYASGPDRRYLSVPGTRDWPSKLATDVHPLAGYRVAPESQPAGRRGVDLLLVLATDGPGRYGFTRIRVAYRAGSKHYRETFLSSYAYCPRARLGALPPACPAPKQS